MVISDTTQVEDRVAIVNFTTSADIDESCVIEASEHDFVKYKTYVNYRDAKIVGVEKLVDVENRNLLTRKEPLSEDLLSRIRAAASESPHLPNKVRRFLAEQGII